MPRLHYFPFLSLLFVGTLCSSMIVPYLGFYIVEGLGREPWTISLFAAGIATLSIGTNRTFANWIDSGTRPFPLIGMAAAGFLIASVSLSIFPGFWSVLTVGVFGYGLSSTAVSTMFSLGGALAERRELPRSKFNAYMRATTSTAWMIGPAVTFMISDQIGHTAVFEASAVIGIVWLGLWWFAAPREPAAAPKNEQPGGTARPAVDKAGLWLAVAFVFCLSTAHSMTFTALPLFYVQEVGLPGYAPGTAFSVKTFVEVFAIFLTPLLISRFGLVKSLLATSVLAVAAIQVLASVGSFPQMIAGAALEGFYYGLFASLGISFVQSFSENRPAYATAMYWNTLKLSGFLAGPVAGLIAQLSDFQMVIRFASVVALLAVIILVFGSRKTAARAAR